MPPKVDPRDWDRLFRADAPRHGGPLHTLANILLIGVVIGLLGAGAFFGLRFVLARQAQNAAAVATTNANTIATHTARALTTTPTPAVTAARPTPLAAPSALIGRGSVIVSGNLRSEPVLSPATVIGQICLGDQVDFLERSAADGAVWYRIRVTQVAETCTPQRVSIGSLGWASSTLLSPPASP